jgi:hypothetical protein
VRFEERVLFDRIEQAVPTDELQQLGAAVTAAERA